MAAGGFFQPWVAVCFVSVPFKGLALSGLIKSFFKFFSYGLCFVSAVRNLDIYSHLFCFFGGVACFTYFSIAFFFFTSFVIRNK